MFSTYFTLGIEHITDLDGYDHMLFIAVLMAPYLAKHLKNIFWLVTAFTLGHSITLLLATLKIIPINGDLIELLIPITILITAIGNLFSTQTSIDNKRLNYVLALLFGLIHGMGFSNYFQALLGKESSILKPLLAFNLGVEAGQILIVILLLLIQFVLLSLLKIKFKWWLIGISSIGAVVSLNMIIQNINNL